ncbi:MAG: NADH-ubiquinone oxidoreductase-F iron-sulfur binding region domain-containing protein [Candidatus Nanopelagicales bacterium]
MSMNNTSHAMVTAPSGVSRLTGWGANWHTHVSALGELPDWGSTRRGHVNGLVAALDEAGLRGRGGGWFPTAVKMRAVADSAATRRKVPVVIGNGMEGEPASGKDAVLLASAPHLVIDGLVLAAQAIGAREAYVAVHRGSPASDVVAAAIALRSAGSQRGVTVQLIALPHRYVASEESALARGVGGQLAVPVFGKRPFDAGTSGKPTLVSNVETLANIALIARFGPGWYRRQGSATAPGTALVTVAGAVANPGVLEVALGTPVADILASCGAVTAPIQAFLTGGYGGAWVGTEMADLEWTPETVSAVGGVVGAGILTVLSEQTCGIRETARVVRWMAGESAGQCGPCRFGLSAIADDFQQLSNGQASNADFSRLAGRLGMVEGRGACKHPDGVVRFARSALTVFNDDLAAHLRGHCLHHASKPVLPVPAAAPIPAPLPGGEWK